LCWGTSYCLQALDDAGKQELLQQIATEKGMTLDAAGANYLLNRYSRAIPRLIELMEKLDLDSLAQQQKLTIPFLRQSLSETSTPTT
jgi:DnaA family protein